MTFKPLFGQITILSLSFVTFRVSRFHVSHLTHETFKLGLQNTLNMSKTTRVSFGVLHDSRFYIWDDTLLSRRGADMIIRRCVPENNKVKLLINVMHHHMEDILQEIEHHIKFSNQVFIGLLYLKTILNG